MTELTPFFLAAHPYPLQISKKDPAERCFLLGVQFNSYKNAGGDETTVITRLELPHMPPLESDPYFDKTVFDDIQTDYPKDPMRFSRIYNQLKTDTENQNLSNADRSNSCKNLCLLDFAVADLKAKAGDRTEAKIMYDDGAKYLDLMENSHASQNLRKIAAEVKKKI